ncbi:MAG: hypothetical protein JWM23_1167 [Microbacteriaceae bacterium]|nr:hypothetical protein [Microbacteriaceae bacterium]
MAADMIVVLWPQARRPRTTRHSPATSATSPPAATDSASAAPRTISACTAPRPNAGTTRSSATSNSAARRWNCRRQGPHPGPSCAVLSFTDQNHPGPTAANSIHSEQANRLDPCQLKGTRGDPRQQESIADLEISPRGRRFKSCPRHCPRNKCDVSGHRNSPNPRFVASGHFSVGWERRDPDFAQLRPGADRHDHAKHGNDHTHEGASVGMDEVATNAGVPLVEEFLAGDAGDFGGGAASSEAVHPEV